MAGGQDAMMQQMFMAFLPQLMSMMTGRNYQPMGRNQFNMRNKLQDLTDMSRSQSDAIYQDIGNMHESFTGRKMTDAERKATMGSLQGILPMLTMFGGSMLDHVDKLTPGGSMWAANQRIQEMKSLTTDPFSGQQGLSFGMTSALQGSVNDLYKDGPLAQKGIRRGEMANIMSIMQRQGTLGRSASTLSEKERAAAVGMSEEDWGGLSEGGKKFALNKSEAQRMARKTAEAGEAVRAIQSVFDDEGKDASIPELMETLEKLGLSLGKLDPKRAARLAHELTAAGKSAGMTVEQTAEVFAQTAALGKQMGLSDEQTRGMFTMTTAARSAMSDMGMFSKQGQGMHSIDEATQAVQQRMVSGAKSDMAFRIASVRRAASMGLLKKDSALGRILDKIDKGIELTAQEGLTLRGSQGEFSAAMTQSGVDTATQSTIADQSGETATYTTSRDTSAVTSEQKRQVIDAMAKTQLAGTTGSEGNREAFNKAVINAYLEEFRNSGSAEEAMDRAAKRVPGIAAANKIKYKAGTEKSLVSMLIGSAGTIARKFGFDAKIENSSQFGQAFGSTAETVQRQRDVEKQAQATQELLEGMPEALKKSKDIAGILSYALNKDPNASVVDVLGKAMGYEDPTKTAAGVAEYRKSLEQKKKTLEETIKDRKERIESGHAGPGAARLVAEGMEELSGIDAQLKQLDRFDSDFRKRNATVDPAEQKKIDDSQKKQEEKAKEDRQRPIEVRITQLKLTGGVIDVSKTGKVEATLNVAPDSVDVIAESEKKEQVA